MLIAVRSALTPTLHILSIYHIYMLPEIRAILLSFLILSLKLCLTIVEFVYLNTILTMKSIGSDSDAAVSLRSKHNTKRLTSFHFEDDVSSDCKYNDFIVRIATVASSFPL